MSSPDVFVVVAASAAVASFGLVESARATEVGGLLLTDTTWTSAGSPYLVTRALVLKQATLNIDPGVKVRVSRDVGISFLSGTLVARGTVEAPIIFTSADGAPAPGAWRGLAFVMDPTSKREPVSILEHCVIEYAGGSASPALALDGGTAVCWHVEIRRNKGGGIACSLPPGSSLALEVGACTIWANFGQPLTVSGGAGHLITNNYIHDNETDGAAVRVLGASAALRTNAIEANVSSGPCAGISAVGTSLIISKNVIRSNACVSALEVAGAGLSVVGADAVVVDNLISANSAAGGAGASGGGLWLTGDGALIDNNIISENWSSGDSGGVAIVNSDGVTFSNNFVLSNWCSGPLGGGGLTLSGNDAAITGNFFLLNSAEAGSGGGIALDGDDLDFSDNSVCCNIAAFDGGGVRQSSGSGAVYATNTFTNNVALAMEASGGGLFAPDVESAVLVDNLFLQNFAGFGGGAISLSGPGPLTVMNNQFNQNSAFSRGGARDLSVLDHVFVDNEVKNNLANGSIGFGAGIFDSGSASAAYVHNTVTGNAAEVEGRGGGFYVAGGGATFTDNYIANNDAALGGGLYLETADVALTSNIVQGNDASVAGGGIFNHAGFASLAGDSAVFNVVQDNSSSMASAFYNDAPSDIDAQFVCWGSGSRDEIDDGIHDGLDDPELGEVLVDPIIAECSPAPGDLDGDGDVDATDLAKLLTHWGVCPGCPADLDGDGNVGAPDLAIVLGYWGN